MQNLRVIRFAFIGEIYYFSFLRCDRIKNIDRGELRGGIMRLLFEIDTKDYDENGKAFVRPSARSIIIKDGKVAMVHSIKYDYYKFPGGGIEEEEDKVEALIRETLEEAGLIVIRNSIKEYGYVHRVQKSDHLDAEFFVQDNYYYLCAVEDKLEKQRLDGYEQEELFTLEFVMPEEAICINRNENHGLKDQLMIEREARVLECLIEEGYFWGGAIARSLKRPKEEGLI